MSLREPSTLISSLSGGDAKTLLEIINENLSCNTEEDFSRLFSLIQAPFPFDFAGAIPGRIDDGIGFVMTYGININFLRTSPSPSPLGFSPLSRETPSSNGMRCRNCVKISS